MGMCRVNKLFLSGQYLISLLLVGLKWPSHGKLKLANLCWRTSKSWQTHAKVLQKVGKLVGWCKTYLYYSGSRHYTC